MSFSLPKKTAKPRKASTDTIVEGPFETTTAAGRKVSWAIVESGQFGLLFHMEPEGARPIRIGRGKADTIAAVLADASKRNV